MKTKSTILASLMVLLGLALFVVTPIDAHANEFDGTEPVDLGETEPVIGDDMNPIRIIGRH